MKAPGDLRLRILVRTDTDWSRMDEQRFVAQGDAALPLLFIRGSAKRGVLDIWNAAFGMTFFEYRARLQRIAFDCLSANPTAIISRGLHDLESWLYAPDDEIIAPIDDDDLYRPDLSSIVNSFTGVNVAAYLSAIALSRGL